MKIIDKKFSKNTNKYIIQCLCSALFIFILLFFINIVTHITIMTAIGASVFIAFTMPKSYASRPRNLIGGYIVGTFFGICFYYLSVLPIFSLAFDNKNLVCIIFSALTVGFTSFVMVITNTEHPPAVGMSLGLVISNWDYITVFITIISVVLLSVIKELLKPHLMDLK